LETNTQTLVVQVEPAPPSAERIGDLLALFYAFLAVIVVIWGLRKIIDLFSGDTER